MEIKNAWICQIENNSIKPVFGNISFVDGIISNISQRDFLAYDYRTESDEGSIDAGGRVLTIPSINFHDHFYSRLAKGLILKGPMNNFHNILKNLWWKVDLALDEEMIRASAQMASMESVRNGVTYIFDHHSSPNYAKNSLNVISDVLKESDLRGALCFEISDRNGKANAEDAINETTEFLNSHLYDENIKSLIGLHASFTLSNSSLKKAAEIQQKYNCGIHIHVCEDKIDSEKSLSKFKKLPAQRLLDYGLLNEKSILAHGIHTSKKDYNIIRKKGSALVLNPESNMNNAVGLPKFSMVLDGVPLLCGTDGMSSNPARSLKQLFLLGRHSGMSFESAFKWIQKIYFDQIYFIKNYFSDFTSMMIGDRADFIIWDYVPPTPFLSENFWGHFIYGILERPVHSVVQNGKVLMNNFRFIKDYENYKKSISEQGKRLFNKLLNK
jgi:cytosine/adenosine deaminase-related metal-dependent hydrolase